MTIQPSNLPPGVTDSMLESHLANEDAAVEALEILSRMNNSVHEMYRAVATASTLPTKQELQTMRADIDCLEEAIDAER
jgi:hypothetical protein